MAKHGGLKARLEARLETIVRRVGKIERDLRQDHDRDWEERATELENDDVLEGLDELGRAEVHELRGALRRIEDGTYGFCTQCGEAITDERLEAVPSAATCRVCAG